MTSIEKNPKYKKLVKDIGSGKKKPLTESEDAAYDKKHGIKENSPEDKKMDARLMRKSKAKK